MVFIYMDLRENIKLNLKNEVKKKVLYDFFTTFFKSLDMVQIEEGLAHYKWLLNGKQILERNHFGTLWVDDSSFYDELEYYSLLLSVPLFRIKDYLMDFLNEKYDKEFMGRDIKSINLGY